MNKNNNIPNNKNVEKRHNTRALAIATMYDIDFNKNLKPKKIVVDEYNSSDVISSELIHDQVNEISFDNEESINDFINDVLYMNYESLGYDPNSTETQEIDVKKLFDEEYLQTLVNGFYNNQEKIDNLINSKMVKWTLDRLSYVDRAIIRLATYEMLENQIPKNIIIDEALELTKELSNISEENEQVKFNNRILDNIAGEIYGK